MDEELTVLQLRHSFCMTIHKSQGSEWNYIIFYLPSHESNNFFINKNLIYTAITRAKKEVWIIGDILAIEQGATRPPSYRCDNLGLRINNALLEEATTAQENSVI